MRKILVFLMGFFTLTACGDCYIEARGVVLDYDTKQPIDSVFVCNAESDSSYINNTVTDIEGRFELNDVTYGFFKCPDMVVLFKKTGYKEKKIKIPSFNDDYIVYLEKYTYD